MNRLYSQEIYCEIKKIDTENDTLKFFRYCKFFIQDIVNNLYAQHSEGNAILLYEKEHLNLNNGITGATSILYDERSISYPLKEIILDGYREAASGEFHLRDDEGKPDYEEKKQQNIQSTEEAIDLVRLVLEEQRSLISDGSSSKKKVGGENKELNDLKTNKEHSIDFYKDFEAGIKSYQKSIDSINGGRAKESLLYARECIEFLTKKTFNYLGYVDEKGKTLFSMIETMKEEFLLNAGEVAVLHQIRMISNKAAHVEVGEKEVDLKEAIESANKKSMTF